jgi:hypothetical protein
MARPSKINALPDDLRDQLDALLNDQRFSGHEGIAEVINDALAARGMVWRVSRAGVQRYSSSLEQKLARVRATTEAARQIARGATDEADDRSAAVLAMIQAQTFDIMMNLSDAEGEEDPGERLKILATVGRSMADLTRSSLALKKHQRETAERLKTMEDDARSGKRALDAETLRIVREEIYGA